MDFDYPVVLIDRAAPDADFDCVLLDNARMAEVLVDHLHAQGHRRITGLFGAASSTGIERREGFARAAARLGVEAEAIAVPHTPGAAAEVIAGLIERSARPDALLVSNGVMLVSVLRALRDLDIEVPRDIALAGFDNNDWMEFVGGGLSVIEQPVEEIGRTAMTMLLDRLDHPDVPARKVVLPGRLISRGSSASAHAACADASYNANGQ